jgi:hypothetical protein
MGLFLLNKMEWKIEFSKTKQKHYYNHPSNGRVRWDEPCKEEEELLVKNEAYRTLFFQGFDMLCMYALFLTYPCNSILNLNCPITLKSVKCMADNSTSCRWDDMHQSKGQFCQSGKPWTGKKYECILCLHTLEFIPSSEQSTLFKYMAGALDKKGKILLLFSTLDTSSKRFTISPASKDRFNINSTQLWTVSADNIEKWASLSSLKIQTSINFATFLATCGLQNKYLSPGNTAECLEKNLESFGDIPTGKDWQWASQQQLMILTLQGV